MMRVAFRAIGIVSLLVVVLGASGASRLPVAASGDTPQANVHAPRGQGAGDLTSYLVELSDLPLATYRGGIAGLQATSPRARGKNALDVTGRRSRAYLRFLTRQQNGVLARIRAVLGHSPEVVHRYRYALNGVALRLAPDAADRVSSLPGVKAVHRNVSYHPLTDFGPAWIEAPGVWDGSATDGLGDTQGEGIIVGMIDTGINMEHPSFAEEGDDGFVHENPLGPGNFVGWCDPDHPRFDPSLPCNSKLIGVYSYPLTGGNPEDDDGHGSHTAATVAGNVLGPGTVELPTPTSFTYSAQISGVAPHANIIAYDACNAPGGCPLLAIVASVDQAVADGVDVINLSLGGPTSDPWSDPLSVAFLNAAEAGVLTATSAGNSGPGAGTVGSPGDAPWMLTVGASTHNRRFANALGDMSGGDTSAPDDIQGASMTSGYGPAPIVYAGDFGGPASALCLFPFPEETFDGGIVVCDRGFIPRVAKGQNVLAGGAGGLVLANREEEGSEIVADAHVLPAVHVTFEDGAVLKEWLASGSGHTGTIAGTTLDLDPGNGDIMAAFSSRGPNINSAAEVIKPDVTAPGVDILAASRDPQDFTLLSGTSMSSPHTAGAAALLRDLHPDWTPAEVKSALMSTARVDGVRKEDGTTPADPFHMGGGRIDVSAAANAGLVLDVTAPEFEAANPRQGGDPRELNLPSLADQDCDGTCGWTRTVTSTLSDAQEWTVDASASGAFAISVEPSTFTLEPGESLELTIEVDESGLPPGEWRFGQVLLSPVGADGDVPETHLPVAISVAVPPEDLVTIDYRYAMDTGETGSGTYILRDDGTFEDVAEDGEPRGTGTWRFLPAFKRLFLKHQGFACEALSLGTLSDQREIRGLRLCQDGSGARGVWDGTVSRASKLGSSEGGIFYQRGVFTSPLKR